MKKFLSLLIFGWISLIFISTSFASTTNQDNINIFYPGTHAILENFCTDKIFLTSIADQYPDYINMRISVDKNSFLQNANPGLAIACFENPYSKETAGNVVAISNPIVQKLTTNLSSTELFFNLYNSGNIDHKLIAVKSPVARQIQLQNIVKNKSGALELKQVKQIPIKANQELVLSDVGYHIMLINFNSRLRSMDDVPLTLLFEDGSKIKLNAQVRCENFYQ